MKATDRVEAVGKAADEEGGPTLSLVPTTERNEAWPTDLLPAAPAASADTGGGSDDDPPVPATPFDGVELEDRPQAPRRLERGAPSDIP